MTFLLLFLLFAKHWIADFVLQFEYMIKEKGQYGVRGGIEHAILHGILTAIILLVFLNDLLPAAIFGALDGIIHYHIDYVKARWGSRDIHTQKFWIQIGADQFAHATFYIWLSWILLPVLY